MRIKILLTSVGNNEVQLTKPAAATYTSQGTVSQVIQPSKYGKYISLQEENQ